MEIKGTNFSIFTDFASKVSGRTRLALDTILDREGGETTTHTVKASKNWDFIGNIKRNAEKRRVNNDVRAFFLNTVAELFGGEDHIPDTVKTAMKMQNFGGSGKPLTARRIIAVKKAIEEVRDPTSYLKYESDFNVAANMMKETINKHADLGDRKRFPADAMNNAINTVINAAGADVALMNVLKDKEVLNKVLVTFDNRLRSTDDIKAKVAAIKANVDELRTAAGSTSPMFFMGLRNIINMDGSTLKAGMITSIVKQATEADISNLRKMSGSSGVTQIHNGVTQYVNIVDDIMMKSKVMTSFKQGGSADDRSHVKKFIGGMLIARCTKSNQEAIRAALKTEACGKLQSVYSPLAQISMEDTSPELAQEIKNYADRCDNALTDIATQIKPEGGKYEDETGTTRKVAKQAEGENAISEESKLFDKISGDIYSNAEKSIEKKTQSIIDQFVPSNGQGSDVIKNKVADKIKQFGVNKATLQIQQDMNNITKNGLHFNIITNAKAFAETKNIAQTLFAEDLQRLQTTGSFKVGGEKLDSDPNKAADQIAKFVTGGKKTFAELDAKERMKAFVVMSFVTQDTIQTMSRNMFAAFDPIQNKPPFTVIDDGAEWTNAKSNLQMDITMDEKGGLKVDAKFVNYIHSVLDGPFVEPNDQEMTRPTDNRTITTAFTLEMPKTAFNHYAELGETKILTDKSEFNITKLDTSKAKEIQDNPEIVDKSQKVVEALGKRFQIPKDVKCLASCQINLN